MSWLALTLELDEVHATAFCDALLEAGALSVWIEDAQAGSTAEQPRFSAAAGYAPTAWQRNRIQALLGAGADGDSVVARAAHATGLAAPPPFAQSRVDERDWVRATQAQFVPLAIGARLWIVPSWREPPDPEAIVLRLDPGLAFGTGTHPTTRLVLEWLERVLDSRLPGSPSRASGLRVLDYGCGSGILAIAAAKLGAGAVDAVDLDPLALQTTVENAHRNAIAVHVAGADALAAETYDVVVANILANPLVLLEPVLAARTRAGGRLALAGILASQAAEVIDAYARDFALAVQDVMDGWVLIAGTRFAATGEGTTR